jgi:NADH-quinone oxidoreductase subunit L
MEKIYLTMVLSPLIGAIIAGFFGRTLGRNVTQDITKKLGVILVMTHISNGVDMHH